MSLRSRALILRVLDLPASPHRLVTLLTPEYGKVTAMALGAQHSRKRFGANLQTCALLEVELQRRRGELWRLDAAAIVEPFLGLLSNLRAITAAQTALAFVRDATAAQQADPAMFDALVELIAALAAAVPGDDAELLLLAFEMRCLALSGLMPNLERCSRCGRLPGTEQPAAFDAELGGLVCRACGGGGIVLSAEARQSLKHAATSQWRTTVAWAPLDQQTAKRALDQFVLHRR